jgi:hypothetical protein
MIEEERWSFNPELQQVIDRQIDSIVGEIYGMFFSASHPDDVSFHDILNRVMLLLQAPVTFVLCKKDKNTRNKNEIYRFNSHPFHQSDISEALIDAKLANQLFPLFETDESLINNDKYYLLVLLVENHDIEPTCDAKFIPLSPKYKHEDFNKEHYILVYKLLKIFDGNLYKARFDVSFLEKLKCVLAKYDTLKKLEENEDFNKQGILNEDKLEYDKEYGYFEKSLKEDRNEYQLLNHGVIDKVYKKSRDILLFNRNKEEKFLANFILFMREFDGTKRCNDGYDYNLRIVICSEQESDIKEYLKWLKNNKKDREWYVKKNFPEGKKSKYYNLAIQINDYFWKKIDQGDEGIESIIFNIGKPFGETCYSMVDPCFKNGIVNFRNPSVNGGLHRAKKFNDEELESINYESLSIGVVKNDLLRIVVVHYLMMGMAKGMAKDSDNYSDNFRVMLAPLEIGGRIPAVIGYVTEHTNSLKLPDTFNKDDVINFSKNWRDCFHIYSDLYTRRLKRDMRSYFWQLYIKMIARICTDIFLNFSNTNPAKSFLSLNKRLEFLTKFFSFSGISFSFKRQQNNEPMGTNVVKLSNNYILILRNESSSFPSALGRIIKNDKFIDEYEIVSRINIELYYKGYKFIKNTKHN